MAEARGKMEEAASHVAKEHKALEAALKPLARWPSSEMKERQAKALLRKP